MSRGWIHRAWVRTISLFRIRDREIEDELDLHLELLEEEKRAGGPPPDAARTAARRQFGNATRLRETSRELFAIRWLDSFSRDIRCVGRCLIGHKSWAVGRCPATSC